MRLSNWFQHPTYFLFWLFTGIFAWIFSLDPSEHISEHASTELPEISDAEFTRQVQQAQAAAANFNPEKPIEISEEESNEYLLLSEGKMDFDETTEPLPKHSYVQVSADDLAYLVDYEDEKSCGEPRRYLEKGLASPKISQWTAERASESQLLSRKCVAFSLNSFPGATTKKGALSAKARGGSAYARCDSPTGMPKMKGGKRIKNPTPCVSKKLVNATYNALADVSECLNLDPKEILPKFYNESGMFTNALGAAMDGGLGQLTEIAIEQVNSIYPKYIEQMALAAQAKPDGACARILKNKALITPANTDAKYRCSLMWPVENPLRNMLYAGILIRYNKKYVSGIAFQAGEDVIVDGGKLTPVTGTANDIMAGKMKEKDIENKLAALGMKDANLHDITSMLVLNGYNAGIGTVMNAFEAFLDDRIKANKVTKSKRFNLEKKDFDFTATIDKVGEIRKLVRMGSLAAPEASKSKKDKGKKRITFAEEWQRAYARTFPEYLALKLNNYDGKSKGKIKVHGVVGYLTALAAKNKMIRETFQSGGVDPNYCSNENYLKLK